MTADTGTLGKQWPSLPAQALGAAALVSLSQIGPILNSDRLTLYHWQGPASSLFGVAIADLLLLALAAWLAGWIARRLHDPWQSLSRILGLAMIAGAICKAIFRTLQPVYAARGEMLAFLGLLALQLVVMAVDRRRLRLMLHGAGKALAFFALFGLLVIAQLAWGWWRARDLNTTGLRADRFLATVNAAPTHPRVIWVLLDELSYRQIYESRYPGVDLPAFDRLRGESTIFTHVVPAGYYTERVLPALMRGGPVQDIRGTDTGDLQIRASRSGPWMDFDSRDNVMADAVRDGYRIGIDGWFNPYCRFFPGLLDRCLWTRRSVWTPHFAGDSHWWGQAIAINRAVVVALLSHLHLNSHAAEDSMARNSSNEYSTLLAESDAMLADHRLDFVFLHMPVPHPPGFYNRHSGRFESVGRNYLDNLVLADKTLAHIRATLGNEWQNDTIVIMGDHSWRTPMWKTDSSWSAEDQRASGGLFDPRPGYIVKLAGQKTGAQIDSGYDALRTRLLLDRIFDGRIATPQQLADWVQTGK
jgi:hypothetical protein